MDINMSLGEKYLQFTARAAVGSPAGSCGCAADDARQGSWQVESVCGNAATLTPEHRSHEPWASPIGPAAGREKDGWVEKKVEMREGWAPENSRAEQWARQAQCEALQIKCRELEALNADMEDCICSLSTTLQAKEHDIDRLKQDHALSYAVGRLPGHLPGCRSCAARDALIWDLRQELSESKQCKQELARIKAEAAQITAEREQLQGTAASLNQSISGLQQLLAQAEMRAEQAEHSVRDLQSRHCTLMLAQEQAQKTLELQQQTSLGQNMECVLAYLVRKLVDGACSLAASQEQLQRTYQVQSATTQLCLTSVMEHLQSGDAALSALLDLAAPEQDETAREPLMRAHPSLRCVALAFVCCIRLRRLRRTRMQAAYWSTREKELGHDEAHAVLVQVCKCVERHLSSFNEQEHASTGLTAVTDKTRNAVNLKKLLDSLASSAWPKSLSSSSYGTLPCLPGGLACTQQRNQQKIPDDLHTCPCYQGCQRYADQQASRLCQRIHLHLSSLRANLMLQKRLAESNKEHARLQGLQLEQEQERAMTLEGHAEALSADIERLCTKLEMTQKESAEASTKMNSEVQHLQHRLALLLSEKDLYEQRLNELQHLTSVKAELNAARRTIEDQAAQLSSAHQHIRTQAAELRDAQLRLLGGMHAASSRTKPASVSGRHGASAAARDEHSELLDTKHARQPLSFKQLQDHSCASPMGTSKRPIVTVGRATLVHEKLAIDQSLSISGEDAGIWSTTRELLHFIRSLDEQ
jgi:hypothetical protein